MGIKAVFFDLDGTLLNASGKPVPGVVEMIQELAMLGLRWVAASNKSNAYIQRRLLGAGLNPDLVLSRENVGASKPSPEFCYQAAARLGISKNEMIYVGDDNLTDAICAINAAVLYANARWSNAHPNYGVNLATPNDVVRFVRAFFVRDPVWYWELDATDKLGWPIDIRSVLPGAKDWDQTIGSATFEVLKRDQEVEFPKIKFSRFLLLYLLATIYLDELHDEVNTWCMIPPSGGQAHRKLLADFVQNSTKLFKANFVGDLLVRHRPAKKAAYARSSGEDPGFLNQANTLHLNQARKKAVEGKHVLVIDDFCTRGHSFECARHLLLRGGATKVTCVSVGRYGTRYEVQVARDGLQWDPWNPAAFGTGDFNTHVYQRSSEAAAIPPIQEAFRYIAT